MMEFSEALVAQIHDHARAVLSLTGSSGYPVALPLPFAFDVTQRCFVMPRPKHVPEAVLPARRISLTLLRYDPQMDNERFLLFHGRLVETELGLTFYPSRMIVPQWGRR